MSDIVRLKEELRAMKKENMKRLKDVQRFSRSIIAKQELMTASWLISQSIQHEKKMLLMEYMVLDNISKMEYSHLDKYLDQLGEYFWNTLYDIAAGKEVTL